MRLLGIRDHFDGSIYDLKKPEIKFSAGRLFLPCAYTHQLTNCMSSIVAHLRDRSINLLCWIIGTKTAVDKGGFINFAHLHGLEVGGSSWCGTCNFPYWNVDITFRIALQKTRPRPRPPRFRRIWDWPPWVPIGAKQIRDPSFLSSLPPRYDDAAACQQLFGKLYRLFTNDLRAAHILKALSKKSVGLSWLIMLLHNRFDAILQLDMIIFGTTWKRKICHV